MKFPRVGILRSSIALATSLMCAGFVSAATQHEVVTTVAFSDDFESGIANWTPENHWHHVSAGQVCDPPGLPLPSGDHAVRFGDFNDPCSYSLASEPEDLTLTVPVAIPSTALSARLKYSTFEATECGFGNCGWDERFVLISANDGPWEVIGVGGQEYVWLDVTLDISAYRGTEIRIAFRFDAVDSTWNFFPGWFIDDVSIEYDEAPAGAPGAAFCFGDGSGTACPCANGGASGAGCANSSGSGAMLLGVGSNSLAADDFGVHASGMLPNQVATLFAGANRLTGTVLGDGLRCAGGSLERLGPRPPDASGAATWGPGLAGSECWSAGDVRRLQAW